MRLLCVSVAFLSLAACSSGRTPETEIPIDLLPGLYDVTLGGETFLKLRSGELSGKVCFYPEDTGVLGTNPVSYLTHSMPGCSAEEVAQQGNAFRGQRKCDDRAMPALIKYKGSHTADSFRVEGTLAQGHDETAEVMHLGSGDFLITGKRIGECSTDQS